MPDTLHALKRVRFDDVLVSIGPSCEGDAERLRREFWSFPDEGFPADMPSFDESLDVDMDTGFPGGRPTRVELYPYTDVDAVSKAFRSTGCFAACTEGRAWSAGSTGHCTTTSSAWSSVAARTWTSASESPMTASKPRSACNSAWRCSIESN